MGVEYVLSYRLITCPCHSLLENPKTYNEKIQWMKIYDRDPRYNMLVDKYEVKKYVAGKIGEEYIKMLKEHKGE